MFEVFVKFFILRNAMQTPSLTLKAQDTTLGIEVGVRLTFVGEKPMNHNLRWYNILFKVMQKDLDMTRIGRNFFMHAQRRSIPEYQ